MPRRPAAQGTRLVTGWGRTAPSAAETVRVPDVDAVARAVTGQGRGVLARGLGRSYGDAAQNAGGRLLDLSPFDDIALDDEQGVAVLGAGVSLDALMRFCLPRGWFVPVTPGTRFVTVGGAIAADVHGKNHHVDGSWGRYVRWLDLVDGRGEVRRLAPDDADPSAVEDFWATIGGLGLTGVVVRAAVRLRRVETAWMRVDTERAPDLAAVMERLRRLDRTQRYSVAWVDTLATGRHLGRGVLTSGDHASAADLAAGGSSLGPADRSAFGPRPRLTAPPVPVGLVAPITVRAFNEAWYRRAPQQETAALQRIETFFHPLDGVRDWNRLYGPRGFVQYQFVVPDHREDVVETAIGSLRAAGAAAFLAVLKRFGDADGAPLSFPRPGWTLAMDLPAQRGDRLVAVLDQLDEMVAAAGGAVYLVKDARCRPELLPVMYPRLAEWQATRQRLDPDHRFRSDLSRRLSL